MVPAGSVPELGRYWNVPTPLCHRTRLTVFHVVSHDSFIKDPSGKVPSICSWSPSFGLGEMKRFPSSAAAANGSSRTAKRARRNNRWAMERFLEIQVEGELEF